MEKTGNNDELSKEWSPKLLQECINDLSRTPVTKNERDWPKIAPMEGKKPLLSQNNTKAHLKIGHPLIEFVVLLHLPQK